MGTVGVVRAPRTVPAMPGGELALEPPPEPERTAPTGLLMLLLPVVMVLGSVGFIAVLGVRNPTSWLFGGMLALSTIGMVVAGAGGRGGAARRAGLDEDRRDYLRYLASRRRVVRRIAAQQRAALDTVHPDPAAWPAFLGSGRLWERHGSDGDFGVVRIGRGPQRLATTLVAPQTGPIEGVEPVTALALHRFLTGHAVVPDLPVALALCETATIWLEPVGAATGPAVPRAVARALVAQYVLMHGPDEALLAVVAPSEVRPEWEWVKWLPHVAHPRCRDAVGPVRMVTSEPDELRRWWIDEFGSGPAGTGRADPHLLVVVDGGDGPGPWSAVIGICVLRVAPPPGRRAAASVVRLGVAPGVLTRAGGGPDVEPVRVGRPDTLDPAEALALARRLARYRRPDREPAGLHTAEAPHGLPDLLGLPSGPVRRSDLNALRTRWRSRCSDRLRVPIGVGPDGTPVSLDLKESAQGGAGPHGLCVGATGSGKSELLRTLVLGLVATHPPSELNFVLVDFKGGATFLGFAGLAHVSAVITNLSEELTLVDRMADALAGEINRRQEVLRAAGNCADVADLATLRRRRIAGGGSAPPSLPTLLVVVDEFSELLAQRPELVDLLVTVGRLGRSLGLHLLLASQRLDEGRLRGLESHLSYRIGLRTFSAAESRAVLGVADAHQLPPTPGAAFLSTGTDELVRFRCAHVSVPVDVDAAPCGIRRPDRPVLPFRAGRVEEPPVPAGSGERSGPRSPGAATAADPVTPTVLDSVVGALVGDGPPAHRVWLPPLHTPPPVQDVIAQAGGSRSGGLQVPVALVDRPYQQRRDPLVLDLSGAAGHLAVVGGPRSGKSTALCTAITALCLTHAPGEIGVHVLDFGGGAMTGIAELPQVGTVADRQHGGLVRRVVAELTASLARRERLFREQGVAGVEDYRARRAAGQFGDEPATDLLLVIDGYQVVRSEFEELEDRLVGVAARGLSYGLHLAVSAARWAELRSALKDQIGSRIELRLGDPAESEVDRRRAQAVPARPGHGLAPDGAAMVVAAPWCDPDGGGSGRFDAGWPAAGIIERCARGGSVGMPPVRLLPARIPMADLPGPVAGSTGLSLGIDEENLGLVELDVDAEPHLVCFADAESGKTALLRLLARGIVERRTPEQARVVLVDYRRGLLTAVPASHLVGYASTQEAAVRAVGEVADGLRRRLPGPDVTPRALRERSWWSGPEVFVLVDDYDLVIPSGPATIGPHPLLPLVEFLPQAKDVGLHLIAARRCGGAGRALFDPVLGRLRELAVPALVMSGSPDEGALAGSVKAAELPPGRGVLVDRRRGTRLIQVAWSEPEDREPPVAHAGPAG